MESTVKKGDYLDILLRARQTIFSTKEIALLWEETASAAMRVRLNYYVRTGKLIRVRRGLYAKDKSYDRFELSTKIYSPSYISFETALARAGITFQFYSQIFAASYLTREVVVDGQTYAYHSIKETILTNHLGLENRENYYIASPERAFLDILYLHKDYYFDNLSPLDWKKVFAILPLYDNRRLDKKVRELSGSAASHHALST